MAVLGVASPAAADDGPVGLTILQTVNLPWQGPEAIVVANVPAQEVVLTVSVDGGAPQVHLLDTLPVGARHSVTWPAGAGRHRCVVTVRGKRGGEPFEIRQSAEVDVVAALELELGEADVDIDARTLRFHANQKPSVVELTLYGMDGHVLHAEQTELQTEALSQALSWPKLDSHVARVAVRVFSTEDTWADASWTPIEIEVPHAPIVFDATSTPDRGALDSMYAAARKQVDAHPGVPGLALYVVGVGGQQNGKAVERNAKKIARFIEKRGKLGVPVRHAVTTAADETVGGTGEVHTILSSRLPAEAHWQPAR